MRSSLPLAAAAASALALAACSTLHTNVDYDPGATFTNYRTYAYKDSFDLEGFQMKRVRDAIDRKLSAAGFTKVADTSAKPDLWVVTRVRTKHDKMITSWGGGWGWGWHWGGGGIMTARVQDVPVGTLVVDLVDAKQREVVWRGIATRDVGGEETPKERSEVVQEAVDRLFENFPPKG